VEFDARERAEREREAARGNADAEKRRLESLLAELEEDEPKSQESKESVEDDEADSLSDSQASTSAVSSEVDEEDGPDPVDQIQPEYRSHPHPSPRSSSLLSSFLSNSVIVQRLLSNPQLMSDYGLFRVSLASFFLGLMLMMGILIALLAPFHLPSNFGWFISCWSLFHWLEFCLTAVFHPATLSFTSFLLNHSTAFHLALLSSMAEFLLEWLFFPSMKELKLISYLGLCGVVVGQSFRTAAMYQAGTNFTHLVAAVHQPHHRLITTGLYGLVRHPAYSGWYIWCIATQLLLVNPLCIVGYALISWRFFQQRIEYEETKMIQFFGSQYIDYQQRVPTGIPFLQTYRERQSRLVQTTVGIKR